MESEKFIYGFAHATLFKILRDTGTFHLLFKQIFCFFLRSLLQAQVSLFGEGNVDLLMFQFTTFIYTQIKWLLVTDLLYPLKVFIYR